MKAKILISILALTGSGVLVAGDAGSILAQAKKDFEQAVALQGGWTSTEKLIKDAEDALKANDAQKAEVLAKKAQREAQLSLTQAQGQQKGWSEPPYIK